MTHLLDTSALLAHFLREPGGPEVQALLKNPSLIVGTSILAFYEFELRLHRLGLTTEERLDVMAGYRKLLADVVDVSEDVRSTAVVHRIAARAHIASMDMLILGSAIVHQAIFVHRDAHFAALNDSVIPQMVLPPK